MKPASDYEVEKPASALPLHVFERPATIPKSPRSSRRRTFLVVALCSLAFFAWKHCFHSRTREFSYGPNPAYLVQARHGAVAAENKICSQIGVDILKVGGNAVDSVISAALCVGTINMFS